MGGQACVFYGAAEFSRDCDIVFLAEQANLDRLSSAIAELQAECIAIPAFKAEYLLRGHAVHFRCHHPEVENLRLDVMTKLRGCDDFESLWERRTTIQDENGITYELLSIEDLVNAKKTQRDKDWPMIRRLVEAHYDQMKDSPTTDMVKFWLRELRTPTLLIAVARQYPQLVADVAATRTWLQDLASLNRDSIEQLLVQEESHERALDEAYWRPLKAELEALRQERRRE